MKYSLVKENELETVYALYRAAIDDMHARGLYQWEWGRYPNEALLGEDVALRRLYRADAPEGLVGVFAVCVGQGSEYDDVPWHFGVNPVCLHRIAMATTLAGKGYARDIVEFVKAEGLRLGCDCFRVDTYNQNTRALRLFAGTTVRESGTFRFEGYPEDFHCFESPLMPECPLLPFHMHPAYRYGEMTPWGGDALSRLYGKAIPDARTGEALEVSCIPGLESVDDMGVPLSRLIEQSGDALTGAGNGHPFPLLLKLLAAQTDLSVQVHPNDAYAMANENGKLGKTEAWAILHAEPGAKLCYGLREGVTLAALGQALRAGEDVAELIATTEVTAGDVLYMPCGMVHAIGGGITLYEIQQSSDVTYRLWDYNRTNEKGEKRELHIDRSLDVIDPTLNGLRTRLPEAQEIGEHTVLDVPAFRLECACVGDTLTLRDHSRSFRMCTALDDLTLQWHGGKLALAAGHSALIPAHSPTVTLVGQGRALLSSVAK